MTSATQFSEGRPKARRTSGGSKLQGLCQLALLSSLHTTRVCLPATGLWLSTRCRFKQLRALYIATLCTRVLAFICLRALTEIVLHMLGSGHLKAVQCKKLMNNSTWVILRTVHPSTIHRTMERCTSGRSTFFALNSVGSRFGSLHPTTSLRLYNSLSIPNPNQNRIKYAGTGPQENPKDFLPAAPPRH